MDKLPRAEVNALAKAQPLPTKKPTELAPEAPEAGFVADSVDAGRLGEVAGAAKARPAALSEPQVQQVAVKKATCPFIGAAVATHALPVRNSADKPLASVDDVVALGNSGGGDLGEVLKIFANGNHAKMPGRSGSFDTPVPAGLFSLDFPGSQGSHPGHSGILQGDPTQLNTGRFSQADFDRLTSRAKNGCVKRSDIAHFIAENLVQDPNSKVFGAKVAGNLVGDLGHVLAQLLPTLSQKLKNLVTGSDEQDEERKLIVALTKNLGENNLVGSAGEFGLLMAFLTNSPKTKKIDGEPAVAVSDLAAMFQQHQFPEGWETWPKTKHDWVLHTNALVFEAGKDYKKLKAKAAES